MFSSFFKAGDFYFPFGVSHAQEILIPMTDSQAFSTSINREELEKSLTLLLPERDIERAIDSILFEIMCNHPLTRQNQQEDFLYYFGKFQ